MTAARQQVFLESRRHFSVVKNRLELDYPELYDPKKLIPVEGKAGTLIVFDSDILSFKDLLIFFFKIHDPTTLNQQGNDIGTQYRSAIFATNNEQILLAEDLIKKIDASGVLKRKITTEVNTFNSFFSAEENHQKYLKKFPDGYSCHFIRDINLSV